MAHKLPMSFRSATLLGVLICLPSLARAAEPVTLVEALSEAYANNATLQEQRASLRATDEDVPTAISGWRPTVTLQGSIGRSSSTVNELSSSLDPLTGTVSASKIKVPENDNPTTGQLVLDQPIYSGGKVTDETRQARNAVYSARAQLLSTEQSVFLNVVNAYVTVITDTHVLALDQNNVTVLERQLEATEDQFNVGEITMTSVAQAQASLAQSKEEVEVAQGNLEIARENFRELVGDYPGDLAPPQPLDLPVGSKDAAGAAAIANNPNVIAAEFTDSANKDAVDVAFAALLPQLSIQASAFSESNPSGPHTSSTGGAVLGELTMPIYQGGQEYSAIRAARAKEQQSFAAIIDAQRTAYAQATQAWEAFVASRDAILSTNAEIKANAIALDGTEREEIVGTRTTLDVLNAQQLLLNSQVQQVQNIATLVENSYTVAAAIGRLTATDLALPVDQYNDLKYYNAVKYAGFGTGESADHKAGVAPDGSLLNLAPPEIIAPPPPDVAPVTQAAASAPIPPAAALPPAQVAAAPAAPAPVAPTPAPIMAAALPPAPPPSAIVENLPSPLER